MPIHERYPVSVAMLLRISRAEIIVSDQIVRNKLLVATAHIHRNNRNVHFLENLCKTIILSLRFVKKKSIAQIQVLNFFQSYGFLSSKILATHKNSVTPTSGLNFFKTYLSA